jgi:hypothetical protein
MRKLITLAKSLDFKTEADYYDYCINSWFNGNFSQCKKLFNNMSKIDKKGLITYIQGCYDYKHEVELFYFNLL